jgi:hypothetical protein
MDYKNELFEKGYIVIRNAISNDILNNCKSKILDYITKNKCIVNCQGITIPDFIKKEELQIVSELRNNNTILSILDNIFDKNYRFCSHNDIGINRIVGWHKDKLNGIYEKYETINIWENFENETHEIVKVLIYLQDHSNNDDGLTIVPYSHKTNDYSTDNSILLHTQLGDIIIFDQRITHRGMCQQVEVPRILVSFGYGKNNIFTDNFEKGTICRQNDQNFI